MNKETRRILCTATIVASAVTITVATVLWLRSKNERKSLAGSLLTSTINFPRNLMTDCFQDHAALLQRLFLCF
jgi:hypothetical protein